MYRDSASKNVLKLCILKFKKDAVCAENSAHAPVRRSTLWQFWEQTKYNVGVTSSSRSTRFFKHVDVILVVTICKLFVAYFWQRVKNHPKVYHRFCPPQTVQSGPLPVLHGVKIHLNGIWGCNPYKWSYNPTYN